MSDTRVSVENGKYTFIVGRDGSVSVLRNGQPWIGGGGHLPAFDMGAKALIALIHYAADHAARSHDSVGVLLKSNGEIACVYRDADTAKAKAAEYNANPVTPSTGEPDEDAPYTAKVWGFIDDPR